MTDETDRAALGVSRSAAGQFWLMQENDDRQVLTLSQRLGLPDLLCRMLASRGIDAEHAEAYLDPKIRDLLIDPSLMADMDKATERLAKAIIEDEPIAVFGDYDVDGATSSSLLIRYWRACGRDMQFYIPDRQKEGYGPNEAAFQKLHDDGYKLLITVDCGTMAHDVLANAKARGQEVIVADHHQTGGGLPDCFALINPRRADDESGLGHLAAVGVTFMVLVGLNRTLRRRGFFEARDEPDLTHLLDLVALGTVCDVVPLEGVNRAFVRQGLSIMQQGRNLGMQALGKVARTEGLWGTYQLGFQLGPRVNAGGRVGQAEIGTRLLTTQSGEEAAGYAARLDDFNTQRRSIESDVQDAAMRNVEKMLETGNALPPYILQAGDGWHAGVIGIVAGRLKDKYNRPTFVIAFDAAGLGKGSARSVSSVDVGKLVAGAVDEKLIEAGGGHAMAAGVTLHRAQLPAFEAYLGEALGTMALDAPRRLRLDASLTPQAANRDLWEMMQQVGPFGAGNPEPRIVLPAVKIFNQSVVGDGHVRCVLAGEGGGRLKAMAFASVPEEVRMLLQTTRSPVHIAGFLRADDWNGRRDVQFMVHDAAPV
ncbi:MAG: single-stranded-DNA-specific exonuclease RecJ [Alphaproteobacteria bacterium]|nr:single-stranded-DNA-specific exonuclease RecJ [Alphaproteobacteria bacterium]